MPLRGEVFKFAIPMSKYPTFQTERLELRPVLPHDAAFILALLNSPKWKQFIGDRKVRTEAAAQRYIQERMLPQLERLGYGNFLVIRKSDGVKLGCVGIYDREGLDLMDLGFAFLPQFEKHGYATEASTRLLRAAREDFGIDRLSAITLEANTASRALLERLGFTFQEIIRIPNDPEDLMRYEKTEI